MADATELAPCPGCGSTFGPWATTAFFGRRQVTCSTCGTTGPMENKTATAETKWNALPRATPPAAVVEAMERALRAADDYLDRGLDKMARNITRTAIAALEAWRAGK